MDIVNKIKGCKKNSDISFSLFREYFQSKIHLLTLSEWVIKQVFAQIRFLNDGNLSPPTSKK